MSPISPHPLARQAFALSGRVDCPFWARGLTRYLAHGDPLGCVRWTFDILRPYFRDSGEFGGRVERGIQVLTDVLGDPTSAVVLTMDEAAWSVWDARSATIGGMPLARLLWAALGGVELIHPWGLWETQFGQRFNPDEDRSTVASRLVWDQCATCLEAQSGGDSGFPGVVADFFNAEVCRPNPPAEYEVVRRLEWSWEGLSTAIDVLQCSGGDLYFEFLDPQVGAPSYSGPYSPLAAVDEHLDLLSYQPRTVRLIRIR